MAKKKTALQHRLRLVKVPTVVYLEPKQSEALQRLADSTRVPKQIYLREGVDMVLERYRKDGK